MTERMFQQATLEALRKAIAGSMSLSNSDGIDQNTPLTKLNIERDDFRDIMFRMQKLLPSVPPVSSLAVPRLFQGITTIRDFCLLVEDVIQQEVERKEREAAKKSELQKVAT